MTDLTKTQKTLGIIASILGIIQAIPWFAMALTCIIEYEKNDPPHPKDSYIDYFNYYVYSRFLFKSAVLPPGTVVTPATFTVFMWIYLIVTFIWFLGSLLLYHGITTNRITLPSILVNWGLITCSISCVDLVLVILIGYDYDQICMKRNENHDEKVTNEELCTTAMIPVLVIAARGFILWVINIIFTYMVFITAFHLTKSTPHQVFEPTSRGTSPAPITPVQTMSPEFMARPGIPRATLQHQTSLYAHQAQNVKNGFWNLNLRTAFATRTPPVSPRGHLSPQSPLSINSNQQRFFAT